MSDSLWTRLQAWRKLGKARPRFEDPEDVGGREAERFLDALVGSHFHFKDADLYPNKRVPAGRRRREIDLIVVTPTRIHVIEVKNWSGSLARQGARWVQTNRSGRRIEHPDLVADNRDKNLALVDYLNAKGIDLDPRQVGTYLSNKVVFMNPRLAIESPEIRENPDVLEYARLQAYLKEQKRSSFGQAVLASVAEWCLGAEGSGAFIEGRLGRLPPEKVRAITEAVDELATWDSLGFLGTKVLNGDLLALRVGGEEYRGGDLGRRSTIRVRWTRNSWLGLFKAITGLGKLGKVDLPGRRGLGIGPDDTALFHPVGDREPGVFPLGEIDRIVLG
jgi:hypothetical protein